jgi:uncharacterized protein YcaQ
MEAQRLEARTPFGDGPAAVKTAVEHLGYVQIDTINVIERCHHHILYTRIPSYRRADLAAAQSIDKSVFETWTHALAYAPTRDLRYFLGDMARRRADPGSWFTSVKKADMAKVMRLLREGQVSIRDIDDDVLVEKDHAWASRKPSRRALALAFHAGLATVSSRSGMLKTYDLIERHFGWDKRPKAATERQVLEYKLDRALRAQAIVSLDSICHLEPSTKPAMRRLIEGRVRNKTLVRAAVQGEGKTEHWAAPRTLEAADRSAADLVHVLSPFDPLVIQRKRLSLFFGYDHRFEAYVPKEKRVLGYFALPILAGDEIVAAIDLKTDRQAGKLLIQKWTWMGAGSAGTHKSAIEEALHRFERFQLTTV